MTKPTSNISRSSNEFAKIPSEDEEAKKEGSLEGRYVQLGPSGPAEQIKENIKPESTPNSKKSGRSLKHRIKNSKIVEKRKDYFINTSKDSDDLKAINESIDGLKELKSQILAKRLEQANTDLVKESEQLLQKMEKGDAKEAIDDLESIYSNIEQYAQNTIKWVVQIKAMEEALLSLQKEKPTEYQRLQNLLSDQFSSIVIMPAQRFPRHEMLIRELIKNAKELPIEDSSEKLTVLSNQKWF